MKTKLSILLLLAGFASFAQKTATEWDSYIKSLDIYNLESKDSLLLWASHLQNATYKRAQAYAHRLKGFYFDYNNQSDEALKNYLKFLEEAEKLKDPSDHLTAVSDLVYVYISTNQHAQAKGHISTLLSKYKPETFEPRKLAVLYNNLGQCYVNEQKIDSALLFYDKSLQIKTLLGDSTGIANSRINLASLYIQEKKFTKALELSEANIHYFENKNQADLWYNLVNKSGALHGLEQTGEALHILRTALTLAEKLDSKALIQISHEKLASLYFDLAHYREAFLELQMSTQLKNELLNEQTTGRIADLQEEYNAAKRERENELLTANLQSQRNRQMALLVGLLAVLILTGITGFAWYKNKRKNELIEAQNHRLTQLNTEKNHLMSVVSHDLSSPFSAIKLWAESLPDEQEESRSMILKTADYGLKSIHSLLAIDKQEMREVNLQMTDLAHLTGELAGRFKPMAEARGLQFQVRVEQDREQLLTDRLLLLRALENLLSNALKYSDTGKIGLRTYETARQLHFEVSDEGKGIPASDLPVLFDRYQTASSRPATAEQSHGLGLYIVKRIASELGGSIHVSSQESNGSVFTLSLPV